MKFSPRTLAFGLIAFASIFSAQPHAAEVSLTEVENDPLDAITGQESETSIPVVNSHNENININSAIPVFDHRLDRAVEASRAFKHAVATLGTMNQRPPMTSFDPALAAVNGNSKSLLSSFLPSFQGQGLVASLIRVAGKLSNYTFRRISKSAQEGLGLGSRKREMHGKALKVIDLLQHSADLGNMDALYLLAHISLFPPSQYFASDPGFAYESYNKHASRTGNSTSQSILAFFHATGYHNVVPVDQAKAHLYYTFAANGGDKTAQMALGYRFWSGIGTQESCKMALGWYGSAAEQAMEKFRSGPPGGRTLHLTATRLSDLAGGVYGPGASVASTGINAHRPAIKASISREAGDMWSDILEYYQFNADRGEVDFAYLLGKIFYQGSIYASPGGIGSGSEGVGAVPRSYKLARHYFLQVARQVWPHDPPSTIQTKDEHRPSERAALCAGYLGRMYLRGEGVKADPAMAKMWFERGAEFGDGESYNGLGIIIRDNLVPGSKSDTKLYLANFNAAANLELAEAQVHIGKFHFDRGDLALATTYLEMAVRHGSPFEAYFYLAEIHAAQASSPGIPFHVRSSSCSMAVSFYKLVSERGVWDDDIVREAESGWMTDNDQDKEIAMLKWWIAAERGTEIAQNNIAYILDQDRSILRSTRFSPMTPSNDTARLALTQWTRSAAQRNIDALVKVGDYYYHGLGVPDDSEASRFEKAARYYQSAADTQISALALWNLGWMYENGVGVPQDFHLAKRHYDLSLETNPEAYFPVHLSLAKLYARSFWHTLMGGTGGLSLWTVDDDIIDSNEEEHRDLQDGIQQDASIETTSEDVRLYHDDNGPWYFGKARDEFRRRRGETVPLNRRNEEDPLEWARNRRNEERERDGDFGPEDYFEGATRGPHREDEDENEFRETMLLMLIFVVISILLYVRTRIVERMRREQGEQQAQRENQVAQGNQGVFPGPDDPARNDWGILR